MVLATYSASVVPMILITWVMSFVEKTVKRYTPKSIEIFFVPMVVLLVMAPLALLAIGPLGTMAGDLLASLFKILDQKVGWILPIMMGMICPLLVMTGMHYSLLPIQLAQYATLGYATLMGLPMFASNMAQAAATFACPLLVMTGMHYSLLPIQLAQYATLGYATLMGLPMFASNMAQAAATFAIYCQTKDRSLKAIAGPSSLTAFMGITEPAMYGVTLRLKYPLVAAMIGGGCAGIWAGLTNVRTYVSATSGILITEPAMYGVTLRLKYPLVAAMIGGGCAGIWAGLTNVRTYVSATSGILSLPVYIGEDGLSNLINAIICIIISMTVSFSLTFFWTLKKQREEACVVSQSPSILKTSLEN